MEPWRLCALKNMRNRTDEKTQLLQVMNFHTRKRQDTLGIQARLFVVQSQGATAMRCPERYHIYEPKMTIVVNKGTLDGFNCPPCQTSSNTAIVSAMT